MSVHKDKVIVLKQIHFSESDLIIHALNPKGALMSFIAKGAVKSKRRFIGGVLEPGHFIGIEYKKSRSSDLHFLCEAWFLKRFSAIRADYDRLTLALHFLSLIEKVSQAGTEDSSDLFNLLGNGLKAIETSMHLSTLQFVFEFRLLLNQGVLPEELQERSRLFSVTVTEHEQLPLPAFEKLIPVVHRALKEYVCGGREMNTLSHLA